MPLIYRVSGIKSTDVSQNVRQNTWKGVRKVRRLIFAVFYLKEEYGETPLIARITWILVSLSNIAFNLFIIISSSKYNDIIFEFKFPLINAL